MAAMVFLEYQNCSIGRCPGAGVPLASLDVEAVMRTVLYTRAVWGLRPSLGLALRIEHTIDARLMARGCKATIHIPTWGHAHGASVITCEASI